MRLHSRVYLHSLAVLLVVGVATSLVFALVDRGGPFREMGERMARHAAALAAERIGDDAALARRLDELHRTLDLNVAIRDMDGRVVASAGAQAATPPADALTAARAGRVVTRARPIPYALAPVRDATSHAVVATAEVSAARSLGPSRLLRPLVMVTVVLLVVGVATRPLARRLSRPLEGLTSAAQRLGRGDLAARVPTPAPDRPWWPHRSAPADEIVHLTGAFNEMAERVQRLVRGQKELLANVSHELRSPLTRIRLALELLPRDAAAAARLADVEHDLAELERLIDDVLTAARLEATGLPARLGEVHLRRLLEDIAARARRDPLTAGRAIGIADGPPVVVVADEGLLRRALWNLVENAVKYGAPPITLSATREGAQVRLSVSDEGPGIAAADRERVLAPFVRLESARTPTAPGAAPRGVGLGLTLARRVAEVHGGAIAIAPTSVMEGREHGCRVTISLHAGDAA